MNVGPMVFAILNVVAQHIAACIATIVGNSVEYRFLVGITTDNKEDADKEFILGGWRRSRNKHATQHVG